MQDFCPLCTKNGLKKKIKAIQINLQEAVWACESEECIWPFGYEDFKFVSRKVGKTWSFNWDACNATMPKFKECIPFSTELSLYTPPVTPSGDVVKESTTPDYSCSTVVSNLSVSNSNKIDNRTYLVNDDDTSRESNCFTGGNISTLTVARDIDSTKYCEEINISDVNFRKTLVDRGNVVEKDERSLHLESRFEISNKDQSVGNVLGMPVNIGEDITNSCSNGSTGILNDDSKELSEKVDILKMDRAIDITKHSINENVQVSVTEHESSIVTDRHDELLVDGFSACKNLSAANGENIIDDSVSCQLQRTKKEIDERVNENTRKINNLTDVPKIVNIERTNFNIFGITSGKQDTFNFKRNKNANIAQQVAPSTERSNLNASSESMFQVKVNSSPGTPQIDVSKLTKSSDDKLRSHNSIYLVKDTLNDAKASLIKRVDSSTKQVTTMKIDGLPPITLSFETPTIVSSNVDSKCTLTQNSQVGAGTFEVTNVTSAHLNSDTFLKQSAKRSISKGKQYKKFSFSALRKKSKLTQSDNDEHENLSVNVSSASNISMCSDVTNISDISCFTTTSDVTVDFKLNPHDGTFSNELPTVSNCTASMESNVDAIVGNMSTSVSTKLDTNSVLETNIDLDSVLDDLLVDTCKNDSQNLDDDWIEFLLN